MDAYLDIETTGLSFVFDKITVIGIYLVGDNYDETIQIVGQDITAERLLEILEGVDTIYTYNGGRFDIPFIRDYLGVDLLKRHRHVDLMHDCWRCNLYGGFKAVEMKLGIERELQGIGGLDAVILWHRHQRGDEEALPVLLKYNREDVVNLKILKDKLKDYTPR